MRKIIFLSFILIQICSSSLITQWSIKQTPDKYSINLSLSKKTFKKFEPVIVKFELINNDDKPLNIYGTFDSYSTESDFKITDNLGNNWGRNKVPQFDAVYIKPYYVVQPGDTLITSMPINNWGEKIPGDKKYFLGGIDIFEQMAYLPSGRKYKVSMIQPLISSNEVEFEVTDNLSEEDLNVIDLNRIVSAKPELIDSAYNSAVAEFPKSAFLEYFWKVAILHKYFGAKMSNNYLDYPELINEYENFLQKYPETYYIYDDLFMSLYYRMLLLKFNNTDRIIDIINERNKNTNLENFLSIQGTLEKIRYVSRIQ